MRTGYKEPCVKFVLLGKEDVISTSGKDDNAGEWNPTNMD